MPPRKSSTMKKTVLLLIGLAFFFNHSNAQEPSAAFAPIKEHLERWDDIRGAWLAAAIQALAANKNIPDRTFPEDYTPYEMLSMLPAKERQDLRQMITENQRAASATSSNVSDFSLFSEMLEHTFCSLTYGRSYGDPHLKSYDRASYSFQTVGEFILSKNTNGFFEVQTRQRAQDDNFSLNSAVAMNVAGDRLCFYGADKPDDIQNTPLRLNGMPIQLQGRTYYLPHGGVVRLDGRNYTIAWPTGETTVIDVRTGGARGFVNVTVGVFDCTRNQLEGLLGNNNGFADDDFNSRANTPRPNNIAALSIASAYTFDSRQASQINSLAEQEFQAYLAKNFAEDWRLTDQNSLFDYRPGTTTASFTDRSFPRIYMTVAQMNEQNREQARQRCLQMGVPADEMGGCIFDQGYLNIPPNVPPTPNVPNPTTTVLNKVERPALNNNSHSFSEGKYPNDRPQPIGTNTESTSEIPGKEGKEINSSSTPNKEGREPIQQGSRFPSERPVSNPSSPVVPKPQNSNLPRPSQNVSPKPASPQVPKPPMNKPGKG